jgi:hypothetical protein
MGKSKRLTQNKNNLCANLKYLASQPTYLPIWVVIEPRKIEPTYLFFNLSRWVGMYIRFVGTYLCTYIGTYQPNIFIFIFSNFNAWHTYIGPQVII